MIFMPYEIFLPIEGYEDTYAVSNLGRVKNIRSGRILKGNEDKNTGYMHVRLFKNGKGRTYLVHRLVISAFKANANNRPCVNHLNENKKDNRLNNLSWCTHEENNNYGTHNKRMVSTKKSNGDYKKLSDKYSIPVYCITNNTVYKSAHEAARQLKLHRNLIAMCLKGKRKSTGGYQFEYYTEGDVQ